MAHTSTDAGTPTQPVNPNHNHQNFDYNNPYNPDTDKFDYYLENTKENIEKEEVTLEDDVDEVKTEWN